MSKEVSQIRIHFQGADLNVLKKLIGISKKHEISVSKLIIMAVIVGLPWVIDELDGLRLDLEAAGWSLTNEAAIRVRELERLPGA